MEWKMWLKSRSTLLGGVVVLFFSLLAIFSMFIAPYAADQIFPEALRLPPSFAAGGQAAYWLGTDDIGRDLWSRLVLGAPVSLGIGFLVVIISTFIGTLTGLLAGTKGGWIDQVLSRFMDVLLALPSMLMAIVIVAMLGPSLWNTIIAVSIVSIPSVFRLIRGVVMVEMSKNYVTAARSFGASWWRIAVVNVLPNCLAPLIVQASLGFSDAILNAAALGFLGLGAQAPTPEWGTMLADARSSIESSPWLVTLPGLCLLLTVIGFNLLGDGLRDLLDPRMRR